MPTMITFTPEAVRDALLAAGFIEIEPSPKTAGFHVADGREQWGCILVEHRIARTHRLGMNCAAPSACTPTMWRSWTTASRPTRKAGRYSSPACKERSNRCHR